MNKKTIRSIFFAMILCIVGCGYVSKAETISFNVTVNQNVMNKDPLSRKAKKADGETNFYVSPKSFSADGTVLVKSVYRNNAAISSPNYEFSSMDVGKSARKYAYLCSVYVDSYYYMQTNYKSGYSKELKVTGKYTP